MHQSESTGYATVKIRLRRRLHTVDREDGMQHFLLGDRPKEHPDTVIRVDVDRREIPMSIEITRGAHSYFPVYFHLGESGEVIISDTMGFLHDLTECDGVDASVSAQQRHLLFGRPPSTGLLSGVSIVDHGERVVLRRDAGRWGVVSTTIHDRMVHSAANHWRDDLEQFRCRLEQAVDTISPDSMLFSGGVDSTLVRTMLDDQVRLITARIPGQQFAPEVDQARRAAALLDGEHHIVDIDHDQYLDRLVHITRRTGLPCPAMQHVLQTTAAAVADTAACYGELGDGTYGFPIVADAELRPWFEESEMNPALAASRAFSLASTRDEDHCFDDEIARVFGSPNDLHRARSARVRRLLQWSKRLDTAERHWEQFLVCGHTTDLLTVGCIRFVRDFASSQDVVLHTPLMDRRVLDRFHQCDPATRYIDNGRTKPVLKALLSRQLPSYGVDRRKLASGLPRTWYFTKGPLARAFDRYPPPKPMADAVQRAIDDPQWNNSWILWPTLSYSVWHHEWFDAPRVPERSDLVEYFPGPPVERSPTLTA